MKWWQEAGVDTIVADEPRSWLEAAKPRSGEAKVANTPDAEPAAPQALSLPADIGELREWMMSTDMIAASAAERLDATGDPASGLMILVDMPERGDSAAGTLLSGDAGLLFDRMLAAMGRDRASTYIAALCPARIAGGAIDETMLDILSQVARRHVALAAPSQLIVMGDAPSRVFCGASLDESRGSQHNFNHDGGNVPVTATFHPRFLLKQPRLKAHSWQDLQMVIEGMTA
ncbi:uracil-DNA glycosylase [Parasphingopyxis sp. CP4]|uniref:uracil-DNA glycosylase family protein n=1 Tax=Parasphingopyxis sp. CP4 TaxID=2724527 RepID=UPI0015A42044|nr:uracil-DNA glycosylase family protein [Parasphingopyxis sp. CP4]QLC21641.1 uracil-DNA glycosylase [Parasphingopyxis sp. CP4]